MKEIYILKDVKYLGISNAIEYQWIKHRLEDNDEIFDKVNVRGSICLDLPDNSEEEKTLIEELKKQDLNPDEYLNAENQIKEKLKKQKLDAEDHIKKQMESLIPALVFEQAKEIGILNDRINAMSGEVRKHKVDKAELSEIKTSLTKHTENISAENNDLKQNLNTMNFVNEKLYQENQVLKAANEKILKDMVVLDENIKNLNEQLTKAKATKKV